MLIERYIREGQPVGSKTLANDVSIPLSSATIRNIMSDLEERGFLAAPHTSAGRIPTPQGLRFFVESLLTFNPLAPHEVRTVQEQLNNGIGTEDLFEVASGLLSDITQLVGVVSTPHCEYQLLRWVEFLPLSGQRVLVILVLNEQEVQNRVIRTEWAYTASELEQAAHYLNSVFSGKDLLEIKSALLALLQHERENLDRLMRTAIEVADKAFEERKIKNNCVLAGENNLWAFKPLNSRQLCKLFEAFAEKQGILHLLNECIGASGIRIFIGEEAKTLGFEECSVVVSPYSLDGQVVGALGVIGPTRMPYQKVIPLVDVTAKLLSSALNQITETPYDEETE
jgi:heat-inducible transcriptional repressor